MKFWELVKNFDSKEFEIVGTTDDDTNLTNDIVTIQKITGITVACEAPNTTTSLNQIRTGMTSLGLSEMPGIYRQLRKKAGLPTY